MQASRTLVASLTLLVALALPGGAARAASAAAAHAARAEAALAAAVTVAVSPKVAGLEEPILRVSSGERCPNCGSVHSSDFSSLVKEEASVFSVGFLVAPDRVLCQDVSLPPENVGTVTVAAGTNAVAATVEKYFAAQDAMLLRLERPLAGARVAAPEAKAGKPAFAVCVASHPRDPRRLRAAVAPLEAPSAFGSAGDAWSPLAPPALLLDAKGRACGFAFEPEWRPGDAADPAQWPAFSPAELARLSSEAVRACERSVLPVTLGYRSPRMTRTGDSLLSRRLGRSLRGDEADETETELNTLGVMLSDRRLLIRIGDAKEKLVRLERIRVFAPGGAVDASFVCLLSSLQGVVVELPQPRPELALRPAAEPADTRRAGVTFLACVDVDGPGRLRVRATPVRIGSVKRGWRDLLTTELPVSDRDNLFVFGADGACLWWNAAIASAEDSIGEGGRRWSGGHSDSQFLPAAVLASLAQPAARDIDAAFRPQSAEDENRLGWLGVDLQRLTRELAQTKKVMGETDGGAFGGLVSRVYPGTPAAQAGVKEGWVLLSVTPAGRALPMKVELEEGESAYRSEFPWDRLDEVPAQYMDQLPTPWPSAANPFVTGLTRLGIGQEVCAAFVADGAKVEKRMTIALSPPTYESAPSFKWKAGGISVCDLTYEVRDYLGLAADAPGVIVSRVESGGKALTAGIRPYEVITQFNGKPVPSAKAFEALAAGAADVRLDVRRFTRDRVVSFNVGQKK